jgi:hypothetical protein
MSGNAHSCHFEVLREIWLDPSEYLGMTIRFTATKTNDSLLTVSLMADSPEADWKVR